MAFIYKSYSLKRCVLTVVWEGREAAFPFVGQEGCIFLSPLQGTGGVSGMFIML